MAGYEAPLRVGYNKVTRRVNAHTEEVIISGEVVLTTLQLMPIVIKIIFVFIICTKVIILVINAFIKKRIFGSFCSSVIFLFHHMPYLKYPQI